MAGCVGSRISGLECEASRASTVARSFGRPRQAWSRKIARSLGLCVSFPEQSGFVHWESVGCVDEESNLRRGVR